ncbi:MAG: hypothetical protein WBL50_23270, partial [Candidatus Acidiferrum sp.]
TDKRRELWVADIDGENRLRIATGEHIGGTTWAPDNSHLAFSEHSAGTGAGDKIYIIGADGSGLRQVPGTAKTIWNIGWSLDQKNLYVSGPENAGVMATTWKWNRDGSSPEKLVDNCGIMGEVDPGGQYLLGDVLFGEKTGIYEVSLSDRNCISLLPGVSTFDLAFARDGKSFLYAVTSPGEVTIYRQPWKQGKTIGAPQVALKVPFAFPQTYETGSAYDFSKDLSTIVYARPGGHADLYLLSQK